MSVRPAKPHISLSIRPVWSESSLCVQWVAKDPSFLHADSEDPDQTGRMPRLIWVFAGRTCHFVGFVMRRLILWSNRGFGYACRVKRTKRNLAHKNCSFRPNSFQKEFTSLRYVFVCVSIFLNSRTLFTYPLASSKNGIEEQNPR